MIRPIPLTSIIVPPRLTYHGEDPTPPPEGGDPSGGGGGDPNPANADIMSFAPPELGGDLSSILDGKPPAPDPATPPAPKPGEKPPAPPAKPGAPPAKPPAGDPPVKLLREELEAVKRERDELKGTLEKGDPKLKEVEAAVQAKEKEIAEARTKLADYEKRLAMTDPAVTKELADKDSTYNGDAGKFYSSVPELESAQVNAFVIELDKLPHGTPEYRKARAEFEQKVNLALGGTDETEHRKLERALAFIEKTHEYAVERPKLVQKIEGNALKLKHEADMSSYEKQHADVRARIAAAKQVTDEFRAEQPTHPRVMLDTFIKAMKPEQVAEVEAGIGEYVELVTAGVRPKTDADFAGMSASQIKEARQEESLRLQAARESLPDVLVTGLRALRFLPALVKDWQRLNAKLKEDEAAAPPDPTGGGDPNAPGDGDVLKDFRPPALGDLTF
jgi:hypothetical protein